MLKVNFLLTLGIALLFAMTVHCGPRPIDRPCDSAADTGLRGIFKELLAELCDLAKKYIEKVAEL